MRTMKRNQVQFSSFLSTSSSGSNSGSMQFQNHWLDPPAALAVARLNCFGSRSIPALRWWYLLLLISELQSIPIAITLSLSNTLCKQFLFVRFYLFIFQRKGKGERKRGRETSMCGCLSHAPFQGPGPQPTHVS